MRFKITAFIFTFSIAISAQNISGSWIGQIHEGLHIVFNFLRDSNGKEICTMDSPDQSYKGIPASLLFISADSVSIYVPVGKISYKGKLSNEEIRGTFSQNGTDLNMNLKAGRLEYKRPQNPTKPYPYSTEEVTFINKGANVTLSGTITYPTGYKEGDKILIVLMVTGSGPQNRDSELYGHKLFLVIADFFARNGIATLRYDDRAVGKSTGKYQAPTTKEVADDAQSGLEFLRRMKQFSKVGILGHSEGANVAFMLGSKKLIDFAISMAAMGIKGDEGLYQQAKKVAEISGHEYPMSKEQLRKYLLNLQNSWFKYFLDYDPTFDIQNTVCPVFAINGDKDLQVISSANISAIEKNMPRNGKSQVKVYPGLNHLFQECITGLPSEYSNIEQTISPVVLKDMVDWIKGL